MMIHQIIPRFQAAPFGIAYGRGAISLLFILIFCLSPYAIWAFIYYSINLKQLYIIAPFSLFLLYISLYVLSLFCLQVTLQPLVVLSLYLVSSVFSASCTCCTPIDNALPFPFHSRIRSMGCFLRRCHVGICLAYSVLSLIVQLLRWCVGLGVSCTILAPL